MRILGLIPVRSGSKGVPGKNVKLLNGKPLLEYTTSVALQSKQLANVVVSTNDRDIADIASNCGAEVPFLRPTELAQDDTPTIDVVHHALEWFAKRDLHYDAVCLLQVTTPFRTAAFLDEAIVKFSDGIHDSLISVREVPHEFNPHWTFEKNESGSLSISTGETTIIPRRQQLPTAFHRDGSIYITKTKIILEKNSLLGSNITYIESSLPYVNIDTAADWEKAEALARNWSG